MLSIPEQIEQGRLVCPVTRQRLVPAEDRLVTADGRESYPVHNGVPILMADPARQAAYRREAEGRMYEEYLPGKPARAKEALIRLIRPGNDYRSEASQRAFLAITEEQPPDRLCLSIGGGPGRPHERLTNLNIDLFPNVDVVADAYSLPYADESVDTVHCEAVLEHLAEPAKALGEMRRVLRRGGLGYFVTPFLQAYHAYPNHYQNYTLEGHNHLLQSNGFRVVDAGTCVGPTFMILDLVSLYLRNYVPTRFLARATTAAWLLLTRPLRPLDRWINRSAASSVLASTVYSLVARA